MRNPFRRDLILLHAPALYDFRERDAFLGPVADAVPSTAMFEMYPVGLTSIAAYLECNHYNVQIVNLAYRMLRDRRFDVEAHLARLQAPVFGIDLHWLPHAQGALAIADIVKRLHPESRVLVGGLSASYYHQELAALPSVDFVARGDSTEEPVRQLLQALRDHTPLDAVENLTWKRGDGSIACNPITFVPADLDYVDVPAYRYLLRSMFKYGSLQDLVPCVEWLRYPITLLLTARGCTEDCATCGGSRSAYARICARRRPAFRSADNLAGDVRTIGTFSRAPIFVVHDIRMGGPSRAARFFELLQRTPPANELIFELYRPAGEEFFRTIGRAVPNWSVEITLESPDPEQRRLNGKFACSNAQVEETIDLALKNGARTVDVFFMVGLPGQRRGDALGIPAYCEHLLGLFGGGRLRPFVAPLGPFLDPGSRAFEESGFGYTRFCRSLEDHRRAFLHDGWQHILSYETTTMSRDDIVSATYEVAERLNAIKLRHGLIDRQTYDGVATRIQSARELLRGGASRHDRDLANHGTMFGDDELKWPVRSPFRVSRALLTGLASGIAQEAGHTACRLVGRYDTAVVPRH